MSLLPANFTSATWGANFVGTLLSCVSWGVLVAVGWNYFSRFPNDRWVYKGLAGFMLVVGTADTAISKSGRLARSNTARAARLTAAPPVRRLPLHVRRPDQPLWGAAVRAVRQLELCLQHRVRRGNMRGFARADELPDLGRLGAQVAGLPGVLGRAVARGGGHLHLVRLRCGKSIAYCR